MKLSLFVEFTIGQSVYLRTDPDQLERLVTGYTVRPSMVFYTLACKADESTHYGFEISPDKDILKTSTN